MIVQSETQGGKDRYPETPGSLDFLRGLLNGQSFRAYPLLTLEGRDILLCDGQFLTNKACLEDGVHLLVAKPGNGSLQLERHYAIHPEFAQLTQQFRGEVPVTTRFSSSSPRFHTIVRLITNLVKEGLQVDPVI